MAEATGAMRQLRSKLGYTIAVSSDEMRAYLTLNSAELKDQEVKCEDLRRTLSAAGVVHGVIEEELDRIAEEQLMDTKVLIAKGTPPQMGKDASFEYFFNTDPKKSPKEDQEGRVDYKDLDYMQNASTGQLLVRKIPATGGVSGKSVLGNAIKGLPGRDKRIPGGSNTELTEDGMELRSQIEGSIVFASSRVHVHAVNTIPGHVDSATGNIECKGSLKINKAVKSGFKVSVRGDLEIAGHVEDAEVECDGNVIVKGGFFGSGAGIVLAKGDVTVKWIENQSIQSDGKVTVCGLALNSRLYGKESVTLIGSKSRVVGGEITSKHVIEAPNLGSEAHTATHLKVPFDMDLMRDLKSVNAELERLKEDASRVKEGLTALYKAQMSGTLSKDKLPVLKKLEKFNSEVPGKLKELESTRESIETKLKEIENAYIVAREKVYPGVVIHFGDVSREIKDPMGPTRFYFDCENVLATPIDREGNPIKLDPAPVN